MDVDILRVVSRWLHVIPVIVTLGGVVFMRVVLLPSARENLEDAKLDGFQAAVNRRWKRVVHICIALILISGLYNLMTTIADKPVLYHALFGVKLLAAIAVFFVASALVGSSDAFAAMRAQRRKWLGVLVVLGLIVVLVSGFLRNVPDKIRDEAGDERPAVSQNWRPGTSPTFEAS